MSIQNIDPYLAEITTFFSHNPRSIALSGYHLQILTSDYAQTALLTSLFVNIKILCTLCHRCQKWCIKQFVLYDSPLCLQ